MKKKKVIKNFQSFIDLEEFYISNLTLPIHKEMEETKNILCSKEITNEGKAKCLIRNAHQKHLIWHKENYKIVINKLAQSKLWERSYNNFEELYDTVEKEIMNLKGVGPLTVFDVSKRIGNVLRIEPIEYIYISRGAKKGAENLLGEKIKEERLPVEKFKRFFPSLSPLHIENVLCILKGYFIKNGINPNHEQEITIYLPKN